ncbi:translocon component PTEX88, putative [Plasmodium vinckei lentum]|uniref:Translocon component PTEX88, putative n=1 Tax=Plasmodium vinckei lentum TaxID=138297 RepID=A0A6V7S326_PLAVN|nr:translocon component PTEX88, putative [Plasmodium vinckei lentum]
MMLYLFALAVAYIASVGNCKYNVQHAGKLILTEQLNSISNIRVISEGDSIKLETEYLMNFPVYCIPHMAIDSNSKKNKKPTYYIKQEFQDSLSLYKNNLNIMPITFNDKNYIAGMAANNGLVLIVADLDIYKADEEKQKISMLSINDTKYDKLFNNDEMFYTGIISDVVENQFFLICSIKSKYFIAHIKYDDNKGYITILSVIEKLNGKVLSVVNSISIVEDRLYIVENAENVYQAVIDRKNVKNNFNLKGTKIYSFANKNEKILGLSSKMITNPMTNNLTDYIIINTKKLSQDKPSSENCIYLASVNINNDKEIEIFNIIDMYSSDINPMYFSVYDIYLSMDSRKDPAEQKLWMKQLKNNKPTYFNIPNKNANENKENTEDEKYMLDILWTNQFNCTINKGSLDLRDAKSVPNNDIKKLTIKKINNHLSTSPNAICSSTCSKENKVFDEICYYDAQNNFVSSLNTSENYSDGYTGHIIFDGLKNYIAFDYKSAKGAHLLSYPLDNMIYIYLKNGDVKINLPQPFGLSVDKYNSTDSELIVYIACNDDGKNYINKCVVNQKDKSYQCFNIYKKKKEDNELFQYISYITYPSNNNNEENNYIYVSNNKKSIYKLEKNGKKWSSNEWLTLEKPNQRVGPVSTLLNYFYVHKNMLNTMKTKLPQNEIIQKLATSNEEDLHITDDEYIFLQNSHTVVFATNFDSYGKDTGSQINFYAKLFDEKYHQSFEVDSIVTSIESASTISYYLHE